jgi:hypothetical protein
VPKKAFAGFLKESAFSMEDTTFCLWRQPADDHWNVGEIEYPPGDDPDGSAALLSILDGRAKTYRQWAEDYYERAVAPEHIRAVYRHRPLTEQLVQGLNPEIKLADLAADVLEIGYPARRE